MHKAKSMHLLNFNFDKFNLLSSSSLPLLSFLTVSFFAATSHAAMQPDTAEQKSGQNVGQGPSVGAEETQPSTAQPAGSPQDSISKAGTSEASFAIDKEPSAQPAQAQNSLPADFVARAQGKNLLMPAIFTGPDSKRGEEDSYWRIFQQELEKQGVKNLVGVPKNLLNIPSIDMADAETKSLCQQVSCAGYIQFEVIAIGNTREIIVKEYDGNGNLVFTEKATSYAPSDMRSVLARLATALYDRSSFSDTKSLDNITAAEAQNQRKERVAEFFGGYIGVVAPLKQDAFTSVNYGANYQWEWNRMYLDTGVDLNTSIMPTGRRAACDLGTKSGDACDFNTYGGLNLDLSMGWNSDSPVVSPFVGGGLSFRISMLSASVDPVIGVGPFAEGGLKFMRTSRVRPVITARVDLGIYADQVVPVAGINFGFLVHN